VQINSKEVTGKQRRLWLKESLQQYLVPELIARGFVSVPLSSVDKRSKEICSSFPFGRFRRGKGNYFEMIEIQLDKHGRAAFRLNIGISPSGGINHVAGHVEQDDVWVHYLDSYYEMYQNAFMRFWFSVFSLPWKKLAKSDYECLVKKVVLLLPELEGVLKDRSLGRHIRQIVSVAR
jgi:hypothetical protein